MNKVSQILRDAQHSDESIQCAAIDELNQLQKSDLPLFLLSLSAELSRNESPAECRRLAGEILKNSLDESTWIKLDRPIKSKIKESLLITLGSSEPQAWHASSQVIAKVAYVEMPRQEWPDLNGKLLVNMAKQGASPPPKQGTLEALGYVFKEILGLDADEMNAVLNAVIQAMSKAEQSSEVRLAAVKALQNVLKHVNFANDGFRNFIMSAICDTAESDEVEMIKQEAFGCLVVITTEALTGGVTSCALECMDFWITVCKKVIEVQKQNKCYASTVDCRYIEKPLYSLVPVLLETLLNQERDDNAKSISMCGTECLVCIARTIGDAIVPLAMQFVEGNIKASDWQSRKAATSAIDVILEGPSIEKLAPVVYLLLDKMEDPNMEVRRTAAYTLRRVFDLLHSPARRNSIFTLANLPRVVAVLAKSSRDVPEVSDEACRAISSLAKGYTSNISEPGHSEKEISSELSPFLSDIFEVLFSTSALPKHTPFMLPTSVAAYEALCEVVRVSNIQDYKASMAVGVLVPTVMRRLNLVLDVKASSSNDKKNKNENLGLLCRVLHVIIKKQGNTFAVWRTPFVLLMFCRVLTCEGDAARLEAVLAINALADATGPNFADAMPLLLQYFVVELLFPEYLDVIGNIVNALEERILPYCDCIMGVLCKGLSKSTLTSPILKCFRVITLAFWNNSEKYLQSVEGNLKEKLSAYSSIFEDPISCLMGAADLFKFLATVYKDQSRGASATSIVLSGHCLKAHSLTQQMISVLNKEAVI